MTNPTAITLMCAILLIERDPMTKISKTVYPWEVPVFRSQYGDEKIEVVGSQEVTVDELPDATEELSRLRNVFGADEDTKQSHADIVYGRGQDGVDRLEKAMKAGLAKKAVAASGKAKAGTSEAVKPPVDAAQVVADDGKAVADDTQLARDKSFTDPLADTAK